MRLLTIRDYAEGEENENRVEVPSYITQVSPETGSLTADVDLFNLPSHRSNYNLQLQFNSSKFDRISKLCLTDKTRAGVYKNDITSKIILNEDDVAEAESELASDGRELMNEVNGCSFGHKDFDTEYELKNIKNIFKSMVIDINTLDEAWKINVPELKTTDDKATTKEFKYITFEDGNEYELKPDYDENIYTNKIGKKFVYNIIKDEDDEDILCYIVKTENFINYKFNTDGKVDYIFYSGNPETEYLEIDGTLSDNDNKYNDSRVLYSFEYNETDNSLITIKGYDKNSNIVNEICFNYEQIYGIYNTSNYINRLSSIEKKINNILIRKIYLNYEAINIFSIDNSTNLRVFSHNDPGTKIFIKYDRLNSIKIDNYTQNNQTSPVNSETQLIDYELNGTEYPIIKYNSETYTLYGFAWVFYSRNYLFFKKKYFYSYTDFRYFKVRIDNFKVIANGTNIADIKVKSLSNITIQEKDKISNYYFETYNRNEDYTGVCQADIINYCTKEKVSLLTDGIEGKNFEKLYYYKLNLFETYMPFEKSVMMMPFNEYSITADDDSSVKERSFDINEDHIKYKFVENTIGSKMGIIERSEGVYDNTTYDEEDFTNQDEGLCYFKEDTLESVLGKENLYYTQKNLGMGADYKVYSTANLVITPDSSDEIIINYSKNEYDDENLVKEEHYINESLTKTTTYEYNTYDNTDDTLNEHNELLNPLVKEINEEIDSGIENVTINNYDMNRAIPVLDEVIYYLSNDLSEKITTGYTYNSFDLVETETADNGLIKIYEYDDYNRVKSIKIKGETSDSTNNLTEKYIITNKYYDIRNGNLIAEENYSKWAESENEAMTDGSVTLYYYDNEGKLKQQAVLTYKNSNAAGEAVVKTFFNEEFLTESEDQVFTGSGYYTVVDENLSPYTDFYSKIKSGNTDYITDIDSFINTYENTIKPELIENKFDFESGILTGYNYIQANVNISWLGVLLVNEIYNRNSDSEEIEKIHTTYKTDQDGNTIHKKLDETHNSLEYKYEYDNLGNLSKEISPGNIIPPIEYKTEYTDYTLIKTTTTYRDTAKTEKKLTKRDIIDNNGNIKSSAYSAEDGTLDYTEIFDYDLGGRLLYKTGIDEIEETYTYNIYGITNSIITGKDGENLTTAYNKYDKMGNKTHEYTNLALNSGTFNEAGWISEKEYDDFGNVKIEKIKYDTEIIHTDENISNGDFITKYYQYNSQGKKTFETTDRYTDFTDNRNKLDDIEYEYNEYGRLDIKTYYDWQNDALVTYTEDYDYDKLHRNTVIVTCRIISIFFV